MTRPLCQNLKKETGKLGLFPSGRKGTQDTNTLSLSCTKRCPGLPGGGRWRAGPVIHFHELCQKEASHCRSLTAHLLYMCCYFYLHAPGPQGLLVNPYLPFRTQPLCSSPSFLKCSLTAPSRNELSLCCVAMVLLGRY